MSARCICGHRLDEHLNFIADTSCVVDKCECLEWNEAGICVWCRQPSAQDAEQCLAGRGWDKWDKTNCDCACHDLINR